MPRNMSFSMTTSQFRNRTKTVTRRKGWKFLKSGDIVMGCKKCMGLRPGEKIQRLGLIRVTSVRRESLCEISSQDVVKEGFPNMLPKDFVAMFVEHMGGDINQDITRIEYEYL